MKDISPYIEISESTLYPILKRLENAKYIDISVMDENGDTLSAGREDFSDKYTLVKGLNSDGILSNAFERGKSYRICVGVLDESRNLIYRWQDYVTIK